MTGMIGSANGTVQAAPALFAPEAVRRLARQRLLRHPPAEDLDPERPAICGDHVLNDGTIDRFSPGPLRRAAVLIPIVAREDGATIILTRRTDHLPAHPGQVAFPGGKIEARDASPLAAALRETQEEIGIPPDRFEPLGYLDLYQSGSGYRIVPVVAMIGPEFELVVDADEVAAVFEVPLSFLMSPANHRRETGVFRGLTRNYYAISYADQTIWGVTAGIIRSLYQRVYA